ncbi:MAG: hypothetical protein IPN73_16860 [Saprospiraceae bacterium]|nr:hypothetical protein [Saprospiraceae bacterium]
MNRIIFTLVILILLNFKTIGQIISDADKLEWKVIDNAQNLQTKSIDRIGQYSDDLINYLWYDEESIGKCAVSFNSMDFNKNLNQAFQFEDTISTPFKINFRWFLDDKPEDGSSFEKNYFISDTLDSVEIDLHTLTVNTLIPLGFQIFFENDYFSSRMFTNSEDEKDAFLYPINQTLKQEIIENKVKGILKAEYKFSEKDSWQKRELHQLGELFEVEIEYQYNMKNE